VALGLLNKTVRCVDYIFLYFMKINVSILPSLQSTGDTNLGIYYMITKKV